MFLRDFKQPVTQKEIKWVTDYVFYLNTCGIRGLFDVYDRPSETKKQIWQQIKNNTPGYVNGLTIMGYNTSQFTCGYIYKYNNHNVLRVETRDNTYDIILREYLLDLIIKSGWGDLLW